MQNNKSILTPIYSFNAFVYVCTKSLVRLDNKEMYCIESVHSHQHAYRYELILVWSQSQRVARYESRTTYTSKSTDGAHTKLNEKSNHIARIFFQFIYMLRGQEIRKPINIIIQLQFSVRIYHFVSLLVASTSPAAVAASRRSWASCRFFNILVMKNSPAL